MTERGCRIRRRCGRFVCPLGRNSNPFIDGRLNPYPPNHLERGFVIDIDGEPLSESVRKILAVGIVSVPVPTCEKSNTLRRVTEILAKCGDEPPTFPIVLNDDQ